VAAQRLANMLGRVGARLPLSSHARIGRVGAHLPISLYRSSSTTTRLVSTAALVEHDDDDWEAQFTAATADVCDGNATHQDSSMALRELVKTGLLEHTALRDDPERFFKAHRLLARHAVHHGPGFWIRFTVHYNLCFGTVLAVGNPDQVAAMEDVQEQGLLGCFALTEKLAGVQSGLLVQTTAEYDSAANEFVLNTPTEGSKKNWISQGFVADKAVVLATLTVDGESKGPHAFLMDLRHEGELAQGVSVGDMGVKTTGNDLDNAWIALDQVRLPRSALLNRFADINEGGKYELREAGIRPFEMIGQRLFTGRVAVAQAALSYRRKLFEVTKEYADAKPIWSAVGVSGGAPPALASIPQLRSLFDEAEETASRLEAFVGQCEEKLTPLLRSGGVPDEELAHEIATAKVKAVEASIDLCWRLKQEVGSYALMGTSGFVHLDFLQCCKFAEGDSRVLMLKMARDRLRRFGKEAKAGIPPVEGQEAEQRLCLDLAGALAPAKGDKALEAQLWDSNWRTVYALAEAVMARTLDNVVPA